MKKADYIAKYGEEAWNAKAEKRREYFKQYNNKRKEYLKQYKEANRDRIAEYNKQYYESNKERIDERHKQYCQDNKEHITEQAKQYRGTQRGRANNILKRYIQTDKERGFPTDQNIDEDWIIENIFNSSCIYCGDDDWTHLGADRIDNSKPHTPDNCVCACEKCNKGRNNRYSVQDFIKIKQGKNLQNTIC